MVLQSPKLDLYTGGLCGSVLNNMEKEEMKFRKKPVVIESVQYLGNNGDEIQAFVENGLAFLGEGKIGIRTLEGTMEIQLCDWVIKGVKGEFYPCKPDIFEATYEAVEP